MQSARAFSFSQASFIKGTSLIARLDSSGSINVKLTPELVDQMAGPSSFPIESEVGNATSEVSINFQNFNKEILQQLSGAVPQIQSIGTNNIIDFENVNGSLAGTAATDSLKTDAVNIHDLSDNRALLGGTYLFECTATNKITLTTLSSGLNQSNTKGGTSANWEKGIIGEYDWTSNGDIILSRLGGESPRLITFSFGTTAPTIGDKTLVTLFPQGSEAFVSPIGSSIINIPEVGVIVKGRDMRKHGSIIAMVHRVIFPGVEFNFADEFASTEITGKALWSPDHGRVMRVVGWGEY